MIPILLLAGGKSARMRGADKLLEVVKGEPLLRRQVRMAQATGAPVFVAMPPGAQARKDAIAGCEVQVIEAAHASEGMSGTLRDGVAGLPEGTDFMVLLADLVQLQTQDLNAVFAARTDEPDHLIWRGATPNGDAGHPVLFAAALRDQFEALQGDTGARPITKAQSAQTHLVRFADDRARFDLDTPQEWAAWRATWP
jgi:molybdenum cofactor cytidylyltransferase